MRTCVAVLVAASLSCGCARIAQQMGSTAPAKPVSGTGQLLPGSQVRGSGFLGDYSTLHALPDKPGEWEYVKPGVDWRQYQAIMLRPMEVWVNPSADYPVIHIELYRKIESTFVEIVSREFRDGGYRVVDEPGPDVLVFHYALTGVTPVRQGLTPTDVLPLKAAITAVRYATGTEAYYVALSGEMEVTDGASGERVYAMVGARHSFATELRSDEITWDELRDSVTYFARQWRTRLDRARGVGKS